MKTILISTCVLTALAQTPALPLADLSLPAGSTSCRLVPSPTDRVDDRTLRSGLWAGLPISTNPWVGADRRVLASIRARTGGMPPVVDGPPNDRAESARFMLRLADGIEEGYAALYAPAAGPGEVTVFALRGTNAAAMPGGSRPDAHLRRLRRGDIALFVDGPAGACTSAVLDHARRLGFAE